MGKNTPKAPISLRTYYWLRSTISPIQTAKYLSIESAVFGVFSIVFMLYMRVTDPIIYALTVIFFIIISVSFYVLNQPERRDYPTRVLDISYFTYILTGILFASLSIGYSIWSKLRPESYIGVILGSLYLFSIIYRSRKYQGERDYFTDSFSKANRDWERASVALEQALSTKDDNIKESFYWAKKAEGIYEGIIEDEERVTYRDAANAFSVASNFVSASMFTKSKRSYSLWKAAENSIEQAMDFLSFRVCDNCGRKKPLDDCKAFIDDGERVVVCQNCVQQQKANKRKRDNSSNKTGSYQQRRNRSSEENKSQNRNDRNQQNRSQHKNRTKSKSRDNNSNKYSTPRQTKNKDMDVSKALEALHLDEMPNDTSKVHSAFRDRVKEVHPDIGGSAEEFKEVKKAREYLVNKI